MTGTTLQLIIAFHLAVVVILLLRPRPPRRAATSQSVHQAASPTRFREDDPGAHLREVAEAMLDESDALRGEAADRETLGLHDDASELRARADEIDAMTDLVIAEARRLLELGRSTTVGRADEPEA